jgi:hypothetical protein
MKWIWSSGDEFAIRDAEQNKSFVDLNGDNFLGRFAESPSIAIDYEQGDPPPSGRDKSYPLRSADDLCDRIAPTGHFRFSSKLM